MEICDIKSLRTISIKFDNYLAGHKWIFRILKKISKQNL